MKFLLIYGSVIAPKAAAYPFESDTESTRQQGGASKSSRNADSIDRYRTSAEVEPSSSDRIAAFNVDYWFHTQGCFE